MREAQRSYEANINVISATRRMLQRTIDILKAWKGSVPMTTALTAANAYASLAKMGVGTTKLPVTATRSSARAAAPATPTRLSARC